MIMSFNTILAVATGTLLGAILLSLGALWTAHRATRRALAAQAGVAEALERAAQLESALANATVRLQELLAERERTAALPTRPSLREAVALSRHGASTEELMSTCRIGQSEARLIQMLYGGSRPAADVH
jgi:hypothetical protein